MVSDRPQVEDAVFIFLHGPKIRAGETREANGCEIKIILDYKVLDRSIANYWVTQRSKFSVFLNTT